MRIACALALALALLLVMAASVQARPSESVAVIGLGQDMPLARQLEIELRALGFSVVLIEGGEGEPLGEMERLARESGVAAAIRVTRSDAPRIEIWVLDRVTGKLVRRTIDTAGTDPSPRIVALRAIELLRASLRELEAPEPPPRGEVEVSRPVTTLIRSPLPAFELGLGAAAAFSPGGLDESYHLWVDAGYFADPNWGLALHAMVPLHSVRVDGVEGSAAVSTLTLGAGPALRVVTDNRRWQLDVGAGLGAALLRMEGAAVEPFTSETDLASAPLGFGSVRFGVRFSESVALGAGVVFGALLPAAEIEFAGRRVATWGSPYGAGIVRLGIMN